MGVTVIGCDGSRAIDSALLAGATLVVGAARHLSSVDTATAETVVLGPLAPALERVANHHGHAVVLASGDPGFFGIVRSLRAQGIEPRVIPAVSSVAAAFARAGLNWDDAVVVSAHGRDLTKAVNVCRAHPKVAVLTGPGSGPAALAAALDGVPRTLLIAENLGTPTERVSTVHEGPWADPNVVLVLDDSQRDAGPRWIAGASPGPASWALAESAYAHRDGMITKAEVRALVLARLGPRIGDLVWDVGAGSGSVAAECARFGAAVIAVERDPGAIPLISQNTAGLGVQIVPGDAPACLAGLPDPDAVFVGGGGPDVLAACARRRPARLVTAVAALERVGPALRRMRDAGYTPEGTALQASRLHALPDGSHRLAPVNPVFVLWGGLS